MTHDDFDIKSLATAVGKNYSKNIENIALKMTDTDKIKYWHWSQTTQRMFNSETPDTRPLMKMTSIRMWWVTKSVKQETVTIVTLNWKISTKPRWQCARKRKMAY